MGRLDGVAVWNLNIPHDLFAVYEFRWFEMIWIDFSRFYSKYL